MRHDSSDKELMERLADGDIQALGTLFLHHGEMVRNALIRFAPELADADVEELSQDVFLALHASAKRYQDQKKLKSWLFGITLRKARAWRRKTWLRRKLLDLHAGKSVGMALPMPEGAQRGVEHREEAQEALRRLSTKQREVVLLHAVDGFSCEEIARILGVHVGVVWSRLHRARKTLARTEEFHTACNVLEGEL